MPTDTSIFESSSCHFHEDQDIHVEWFLAEDDPDRDLQNVRGLIIDAEVVPQVRDLQTTGTSRLVGVSDRESLFTKVQLISTCFVDNNPSIVWREPDPQGDKPILGKIVIQNIVTRS